MAAKKAAVVAAVVLAFVGGFTVGQAWSFMGTFERLGSQVLKDVFEQPPAAAPPGGQAASNPKDPR